MGLDVIETTSARGTGLRQFDYRTFASKLRPYLARNRDIVFISTHVTHSLSFLALNIAYRRRAAHLLVVHGADTTDVYRQSRLLNGLPVTVVAVSEFARDLLLKHGVDADKLNVITNYLPADYVERAPRRAPFDRTGVRRAAVVSRLVPLKRIDLLLTCLEQRPELRSIEFHVYGDGPEADSLRARAVKSRLSVVFEGFREDVSTELAHSDVLVHLCPVESFSLVLLEAMAAGIPVLVPDSGGAVEVVEDGVSGLYFAANDPASLGARLAWLQGADPEVLNRLTEGARIALSGRLSEHECLAKYRSLIMSRFGFGDTGELLHRH